MFHKKEREAGHCLQRGSWSQGTVRHLIPRIEVEIADLEPTIGAEDVEDAVRRYFDQGPELELRVSLSKTP